MDGMLLEKHSGIEERLATMQHMIHDVEARVVSNKDVNVATIHAVQVELTEIKSSLNDLAISNAEERLDERLDFKMPSRGQQVVSHMGAVTSHAWDESMDTASPRVFQRASIEADFEVASIEAQIKAELDSEMNLEAPTEAERNSVSQHQEKPRATEVLSMECLSKRLIAAEEVRSVSEGAMFDMSASMDARLSTSLAEMQSHVDTLKSQTASQLEALVTQQALLSEASALHGPKIQATEARSQSLYEAQVELKTHVVNLKQMSDLRLSGLEEACAGINERLEVYGIRMDGMNLRITKYQREQDV